MHSVGVRSTCQTKNKTQQKCDFYLSITLGIELAVFFESAIENKVSTRLQNLPRPTDDA